LSKSEKPPIAVRWDGHVFVPADPLSEEMAAAFSKDARLNAVFTQSIPVTWDGRVFRPADMPALEAANNYLLGSVLDGHFKRPAKAEDWRSGQMRLWWAGLKLLVDALGDERWPTTRKMHNLILEELGFTERIWRIDGSYRNEVDSIAIDNMEDEAFEALFERARVFCLANFGFDPWQQWVDEKDAARANRRRQ
jgi:hypothetical protein